VAIDAESRGEVAVTERLRRGLDAGDATRTAVYSGNLARETQMHFVKCCSEKLAIGPLRRVPAARGTNLMPGVTSVAAASERMHLRLAGYCRPLLQERRRFADHAEWTKSTYSTKTTSGGTLRLCRPRRSC
jgi:hypothetical protein